MLQGQFKYGTQPEKATTAMLWSQAPTHRVTQASIDATQLYKYGQPIALKLYANNMTVVEYSRDYIKYYYKDYAYPLCMPARGKYAANHQVNDIKEPMLESQLAATKQVQSPTVPVCQQAHHFRQCSYGNARTGTKKREHASLAHIYRQDEQASTACLPDKGARKPPVESAICLVGHIIALACHIHNSATTAIPLHQVNTTSRQYCHTQGIVVNSRIIIPQGVKASCHCKRLTATHTDSTSAPTRAVHYDASQPATTLTVHHQETIPYTKCTTECQHKLGTCARSST